MKPKVDNIPDGKVHGAKMGPIWGRQDPIGPHVGPMNFVIWDVCHELKWILLFLMVRSFPGGIKQELVHEGYSRFP